MEGLAIARVPGRKGLYLAILDDRAVHVVARPVGNSEASRQRSLDTFVAWVRQSTGSGPE